MSQVVGTQWSPLAQVQIYRDGPPGTGRCEREAYGKAHGEGRRERSGLGGDAYWLALLARVFGAETVQRDERPNLHPGGARDEVRVRQVQVEGLGRRVGDVRRERLGLGHALLRRHAADAPQHGRVRAL